ncbi:MAG: VanZ family protein [Ruminococcus sp.]|nr:VanZ family protein [Ruminococcus sp.]
MISMKKNTRKVILALCIAGCLGFIWTNSVMPGHISSEFSSYAGKIIKMIFGESLVVSETIIRKLAHCCEFGVFGLILSLFFYEKLADRLPLVGFFGLGAAVLDETIQLFSDGRSSQIKDVWIDFSGFTAGTLFIFIIYLLDKEVKGKHGRL